MSAVRTRFAPSPTGFVHIGSLRTALFSMLYARKHGGQTILRIEDTDQTRLVTGAVENLLQVMQRMGLSFDEGPRLNNEGSLVEHGEFGPYTQSERLDLYEKYAKQLVESGLAYYAFETEDELTESRQIMQARGLPPRYDRFWRNADAEMTQQKLTEVMAAGNKPVIRFAMPLSGEVVVNDLVYGQITYDLSLLDDVILLKSDGYPTYHLAAVVDDHLMNISHIIRGEEWLPSTPLHMAIYQAFGWTPPAYAHLPLLLNADRSKLSKRQGDVAVEDFLVKGYLPEALINFVAFLGWNPKTEREIFSLAELVEEFDFNKINRAGAVVDPAKLDWMNAQYLKNFSDETLLEMVLPYWKDCGVTVSDHGEEFLLSVVKLERDRWKKLEDAKVNIEFYFADPEIIEPSALIWKKSDAAITSQVLSALISDMEQWPAMQTADDIKAAVAKIQTAHEWDNGTVLWPLRFALTGLEKSPGPFEVLSVFGRLGDWSVAIRRLRRAQEFLS